MEHRNENDEPLEREDRIRQIRELLGFDKGMCDRSDEKLHYDELSTVVRELNT